jgi:uncharacterized protein YodC (DUF2158 family)
MGRECFMMAGKEKTVEGKTMNINVGDVVKLKSGGPKMTVEKIVPNSSGDSQNIAQCCWFVRDEEAKTDKFGIQTLKPVPECQTS